ncbi:hypothetical protein D3C72_2403040 [compost metagenome]
MHSNQDVVGSHFGVGYLANTSIVLAVAVDNVRLHDDWALLVADWNDGGLGTTGRPRRQASRNARALAPKSA